MPRIIEQPSVSSSLEDIGKITPKEEKVKTPESKKLALLKEMNFEINKILRTIDEIPTIQSLTGELLQNPLSVEKEFKNMDLKDQLITFLHKWFQNKVIKNIPNILHNPKKEIELVLFLQAFHGTLRQYKNQNIANLYKDLMNISNIVTTPLGFSMLRTQGITKGTVSLFNTQNAFHSLIQSAEQKKLLF